MGLGLTRVESYKWNYFKRFVDKVYSGIRLREPSEKKKVPSPCGEFDNFGNVVALAPI